MEGSKIYDLIIDGRFDNWLNKITNEKSNVFKKDVEECKRKLCEKASEEQIKHIEKFQRAIKFYWEDVYNDINIRLLNLGIQIGMQLQNAFAQDE